MNLLYLILYSIVYYFFYVFLLDFCGNLWEREGRNFIDEEMGFVYGYKVRKWEFWWYFWIYRTFFRVIIYVYTFIIYMLLEERF